MKRNKSLIDKELTPKAHRCVVGACPAIFKSTRKSYFIVGKIVAEEDIEDEIKKRIGEGEVLIEIPTDIIDKME